MKNNIKLDTSASDLSSAGTRAADRVPRMVQRVSLAMALFTSSISLGISVFAGLQRAGSVEEQVWSVATSVVAVLCTHLLPMLCRFVSRSARCALVVLWLLATVVVLRGQLDVLVSANTHAADKRALTVPLITVPPVATALVGRGLTVIARDIAKVSIDLAQVEARRCIGECRALQMRKVELSAELVALNAEATEAKRRETEQDWLRDQVSRAEALRESRRANPATSMFAHWIGTTESRLNLLLNFVAVLVLEGAACAAWYFAMPKPVRLGHAAVAYDATEIALQPEGGVPTLEATPAGRVEQAATHVTTVCDEGPFKDDATPGPVMSDDDRVLKQIHEAVVAGRLIRNLASIRKFVGCAQSRAIQLNRRYIDRFGVVRSPKTAPNSRASITCP